MVLGLETAESVEVFAPEGVSTNDTGNSKSGVDLTWDDTNMAANCTGAVFVVGQIDDTETQASNETWGHLAEMQDLRGQIGVTYKNIGNYNGTPVDLKVTVTDYVINENDTYRLSCTNLDPAKGDLNYSLHNAVIGLYTTGGKPGIQVINIPWVELKYEFYVSGTDTRIEVKGNTSYYDIDEYQAVFLDSTCKGIYVTDGDVSGTYVKDGEIRTVTLESGAHNRCVLNLGWLNDGSSGVGVYSSYDGGVSSSISSVYTANAFTEVFEGSTLVRTFNFQNANYPSSDPNLQSNGPDGTIFNSGLPVNREGSLYIKKEVVASESDLIDTNKLFTFVMTVKGENNHPLSGEYGDLTFDESGKAAFTLTHNQGIQVMRLPAGAAYVIQETDYDGYSVSGTNSYYNADTKTASTESFEGDTISGTVQASVDIAAGFIPTAKFKNEAAAELSVKKLWKWGNEDLDTAQMEDVSIYAGLYKNDGMTPIPDKYIELNSKHTWEAKFTGLTDISNYTVKELRPVKTGETAEFTIKINEQDCGYIGMNAPEKIFIDGYGYTAAAPEYTEDLVTITNTLIPITLEVVKVAAGDSNIKLEGAAFELKEVENSVETAVAAGTTNKDGMLRFDNLKPGTYTLTETVAPTGYAIAKEPIEITLSYSDLDNPVIRYTVTNAVLYQLPDTGGHGTYRYMISGAVLMMGAVMILYKRNVRGI